LSGGDFLIKWPKNGEGSHYPIGGMQSGLPRLGGGEEIPRGLVGLRGMTARLGEGYHGGESAGI